MTSSERNWLVAGVAVIAFLWWASKNGVFTKVSAISAPLPPTQDF